MYVNEIGMTLGVKFVLYADDMKVSAIISNLYDCIALKLHWLKLMCGRKNNLFLNVVKCSAFWLKKQIMTHC